MKRQHLSRRASKRNFASGATHHPKNYQTGFPRGGIRM